MEACNWEWMTGNYGDKRRKERVKAEQNLRTFSSDEMANSWNTFQGTMPS